MAFSCGAFNHGARALYQVLAKVTVSAKIPCRVHVVRRGNNDFHSVERSVAFFPRHVDIQRQPQAMYLRIGMLAGIVLVLIVSIKLNVFS